MTRIHHLADERGGRGEANGQSLLTGGQPEAERDMGLARAAGSVADQTSTLSL